MDKKNLLEHHDTFSAIINFINQSELAQKYPAFKPVIHALTVRTERIYQLWATPKPNGRGKSSVKKTLKSDIAVAAHRVSCAVFAHANITGNTQVKNAVNYTCSDFFRAKEPTLLGRCRQVLNAAKKIKDPAHFGLHPHLIEHLNLCIENYIAFKDIPLKVVKDHARAMRLADRLTKQCINILQKQVDPLMVVIDTTETGKLSHYYSIRKICKPAGRKRKYIKKEKNTEQQISQVSQPQVPKITRKPKLLNLSVLQV